MTSINKAELSFLLRRLHSLTGIIPIGGFLLFHFFENSSARQGAIAFNETVEKISEMPYLYILEWAGLLIPILFHSIYGIYITKSAKPNIVRESHGRNFAYLMQRVTGVVAFAYIAYHIITTRAWALFVKNDHITFSDMSADLNIWWKLMIYVIGILAVTFHFSNGIWSFSITWGLVRTEAGQKRLAMLSMIMFFVLAVVGLDIISAFIIDHGILSHLGYLAKSLLIK